MVRCHCIANWVDMMKPSDRTNGSDRRQRSQDLPAAVLIDQFPFAGTVYNQVAIHRIQSSFDLLGSGMDGADFLGNLDQFREVEVILGTWDLPNLTEELMEQLPHLKAVFHAAGEYRHIYTEASQHCGITFCATIDINSAYVAHHTTATVVLSLKDSLSQRDHLRRVRDWDVLPAPRGIYGAKVGLIGLGRIGRLVSRQLQDLPVKLLAHDAHLPLPDLVQAGCVSASLTEIFATCDVVSLHLPGGEQTSGIIIEDLLLSMKPGATLINSSRGTVLNHDDLVKVLKKRPDLTACLDVCHPEPPEPEDPLYTLDNCYLTPHLSGAIGTEREHLGDAMVEDAISWKEGLPMQYCVSAQQNSRLGTRLVAAP